MIEQDVILQDIIIELQSIRVTSSTGRLDEGDSRDQGPSHPQAETLRHIPSDLNSMYKSGQKTLPLQVRLHNRYAEPQQIRGYQEPPTER